MSQPVLSFLGELLENFNPFWYELIDLTTFAFIHLGLGLCLLGCFILGYHEGKKNKNSNRDNIQKEDSLK